MRQYCIRSVTGQAFPAHACDPRNDGTSSTDLITYASPYSTGRLLLPKRASTAEQLDTGDQHVSICTAVRHVSEPDDRSEAFLAQLLF